ncbi:hypothetical protein LOK46_31265 (plasmid) [Methylobacterium sp. NMS14P]|uniref:hypothetical protein n=1 Tax=Methylobacterium sp. NMS14P TaxID=2894310 RepID=UPI002358E3EF|nr:hypothetical protein [Methylobacterium sp. NMS14P]WCS28404.1 hypothetical protein LOK46_31265 [Methylobacterium sp. NMS14P]
MMAARRWLRATALALLPTTAQAALPPSWQRVREVQAVAEAAARVLGSRPIDAVERVDEARYRVRAVECRVMVRLVARSRTQPGPQAFDAVPDVPDCP